jgi:hypothetical protein
MPSGVSEKCILQSDMLELLMIGLNSSLTLPFPGTVHFSN